MTRLTELAASPKHLVVIGGGAVAGSEAARACAERGVAAIVIEQNPRPYGKIEDGLPRWHERLRDKEYARIDENLQAPGVYYVPGTRLGRDLQLDEVQNGWQPSAVILATGAWRDRPLPVAGIDAFVDRGLAYQNPFVYWFNHYHEPGYAGPQYRIVDDAIVVGGGLASIDVAKIINLELYKRALAQRGIDASIVELEHRGIPAFVEKQGLSVESLGVRGCTLYYRRRKEDMPLASAPPNATPEQLEKVGRVRAKVMDNVVRKYLVRFEPCQVPVGSVTSSGRLDGLVFRRTAVEGGKLRELEGSDHEVRSQLIVSSIGSVPEPIAGVPQKGELYDFSDRDTGALSDLTGVFGLGNVLTGKGNIRESRINARDLSQHIVATYLGVEPASEADVQRLSNTAHRAARENTERIIEDAVAQSAPLDRAYLAHIAARVEARWREVGYDGDYATWIERSWPR